MTTLTITHDLPGSPEGFFSWFFEPKREADLYKGQLGYSAYHAVKRDDGPVTLTRLVASKRQWDLPGPVLKVLGGDFRQTEEGVFEKSAGTWRWTVTPSTMADKLREEGTLTAAQAGDSCQIIVRYTLEAEVFGVGGLIKSTFEKSLREEWDSIAAFFKQQAGE